VYNLSYELIDDTGPPIGEKVVTSEAIEIEVILPKLSKEKYYAGYGAPATLIGIDQNASHDPLGFTLLIDGVEKSADFQGASLDLSSLAPGSYTVTLRSNTFTDLEDTAVLYILKVALVPDYNRDGVIDSVDENKAASDEIYRFWINDDDDGCEGGEDIPGLAGGNADCNDLQVDGIKDLVDFMPVFLDLKEVVQLLGYKDYRYLIRQESGALNALTPSYILPANCRRYLSEQNFCEFLETEPLENVSTAGVELNRFLLLSIEEDTGGVVLFEGRSVSSKPLVFELRDTATDSLVITKKLNLRISPVEEMYQRVNLRGGAAVVTHGVSLPPGNGKNVVFLHGFKVTAERARGWNAETFKRLWQSGSDARFHGVTWYGDEAIAGTFWVPGFHYHENVDNAFQAAPHLAAYVNSISGQRVVLAHSLGNMVVSSAIADHGMSVGKYFMLNAAVASEAFDGTQWSVSPDTDNRLVHDQWRAYTNVCWCSKWHEFFMGDPSDDRRLLTWKERFGAVLSGADVYNYYSSGNSANTDDGDEVFELLNETPWFGENCTDDIGRYAWQKQETHKGRGTLDPAGTSWAGWGFACNFTYQTPFRYQFVVQCRWSWLQNYPQWCTIPSRGAGRVHTVYGTWRAPCFFEGARRNVHEIYPRRRAQRTAGRRHPRPLACSGKDSYYANSRFEKFQHEHDRQTAQRGLGTGRDTLLQALASQRYEGYGVSLHAFVV